MLFSYWWYVLSKQIHVAIINREIGSLLYRLCFHNFNCNHNAGDETVRDDMLHSRSCCNATCLPLAPLFVSLWYCVFVCIQTRKKVAEIWWITFISFVACIAYRLTLNLIPIPIPISLSFMCVWAWRVMLGFVFSSSQPENGLGTSIDSYMWKQYLAARMCWVCCNVVDSFVNLVHWTICCVRAAMPKAKYALENRQFQWFVVHIM